MYFLIGFSIGSLVGMLTMGILAACRGENYYLVDHDTGKLIEVSQHEAIEMQSTAEQAESEGIKSCQH
jgi:hypothetical protein